MISLRVGKHPAKAREEPINARVDASAANVGGLPGVISGHLCPNICPRSSAQSFARSGDPRHHRNRCIDLFRLDAGTLCQCLTCVVFFGALCCKCSFLATSVTGIDAKPRSFSRYANVQVARTCDKKKVPDAQASGIYLSCPALSKLKARRRTSILLRKSGRRFGHQRLCRR